MVVSVFLLWVTYIRVVVVVMMTVHVAKVMVFLCCNDSDISLFAVVMIVQRWKARGKDGVIDKEGVMMMVVVVPLSFFFFLFCMHWC